MTGTPTPGGVGSEVRHLAPLLQILRHQPYGTNEALWRVRSCFSVRRGGTFHRREHHAASGDWQACDLTDQGAAAMQPRFRVPPRRHDDVHRAFCALQEAIQRPFEARQREGRRRLMALLQDTMVCASKAKLEAAGLLPSCKKQVLSRRTLDCAAVSYPCEFGLHPLSCLRHGFAAHTACQHLRCSALGGRRIQRRNMRTFVVQTVLLRFEPEHARSYNELVEVRKASAADFLHCMITCVATPPRHASRRRGMLGKGVHCFGGGEVLDRYLCHSLRELCR